ncbi:hypothetical protein RKE32_38220 [Streptomyces sp. Li-HN-5-13]|nr:hypothetical protein RKE32_38220 [Streptomyces sp. Li-HN-5-13]
MKKRSMLALASLATGFVVAAVTPSHAAGHDALDGRTAKDTVDDLVGRQGVTLGDDTLGDDALGHHA